MFQAIKRPKKLSDDYSVTSDVIDHAIEYLKKRVKVVKIFAVYMQQTLFKPKYLIDSYKMFINSKKNFSFITDLISYSRSLYIKTIILKCSIKILEKDHNIPKLYHDVVNFIGQNR